jgi:hypothetical protein
VDPRNGETFYVGKGKGDRVLQHARGAVETINAAADEEILEPKVERIKEILTAKLDVIHIIHRHQLPSPRVAYEVEAALIDAYPGLRNQVKGHHSRELGARHLSEIIATYTAEPFIPREPLMLISIAQTYDPRDVYNAVRGYWIVDRARANKYKLVLAHHAGLVRGAFRPTAPWFDAPKDVVTKKPRYGFEGVEAELETR